MDISIVTICKNSEHNIQETIDSVLGQKDINYEYIIIDGKSSDKTVDIINSMISSNRRVKFISENDQGISEAMNKGGVLAQGKLLFFLHSGDVLCSDHVLFNVRESYCKFNWNWASGNLILTRRGKLIQGIKYSPDKLKRLKYKNCIPHQSTFITKNLFDRSNGFDVSLKQAMDYHLWLKLKYIYEVDNFKLTQDIASFDVDGESSSLIPLLRGNIEAHAKIKKINNSITWFNTTILVLGLIYHWLKYRFYFFLNRFK